MKTKQYLILKVISFVFLITIISSCSSSNEKIKEGIYIASNHLSPLAFYYNKYILGVSLYSVGDTLTIYENKDFRYHTCGGNMFGKYRINKDLLFFRCG